MTYKRTDAPDPDATQDLAYKRKPKGTCGTDFNERDRVVINYEGDDETTGTVEGFELNEQVTTPKVHVRIDKPGHKSHGRIIVLTASDVKAAKAATADEDKAASAS